MSIDVVWLSRHDSIDARGPWDTGLLEHLFSNRLWPTGHIFQHHVTNRIAGDITEAIVVIPVRHHVDDVDWINDQIAHLRAALLIFVGDEQAVFPWQKVQHRRSQMWIMMPHPKHHAAVPNGTFFLGNCWKEDTPDLIKDVPKDLAWSFAGQVTHSRRRQAFEALQHMRLHGELIGTEGFSQGIERPDYLRLLSRTRSVPCPSGPFSPDTFRVYEALEAGAVPIVDDVSPLGWSHYWELLFGQHPLPTIRDWRDIAEIVDNIELSWPVPAIKAGAWWRQQKQHVAQRLVADLEHLGFGPPSKPAVTVIVTSSPSPKHPSTDMIDAVLGTVPSDWPVIVGFDGVREEQEHLADGYYEYVYTMVRRFQQHPTRVPVVADRHVHQANVTRMILDRVDTQAVLFLEHDTPLVGDIDWEGCVDLVVDGHLDVLRFHHEQHILEPHKYLMVDHIDQTMNGVPIRRTRQWSQRPHLANTTYYRKILQQHFPLTSSTMIEDRMHSMCQVEPYVKNRLAIYHPDGDIRRSGHLDGREHEPKFDMEFGS